MSQTTLDELKHFWMPSGVPCFIADTKDICDKVESMGFQIYYLIANDFKETKETRTNHPNNTTPQYGYGVSYTPTTTTTYKQERKPRLFKVVNNFVGRVVSLSDDEFPAEFVDLEEECTYTMPLIPCDIVDKLDEFFRLIHSQHGSEAIVILTYDTNKTDSSGWGVLVPDQTNTAAHCKYDADSIAAIKPDHVVIVGSVHSHPEMAAYASGTDHQDQADFDGIHITYGWQKSINNGATQYYAELQMSGKNYKLDIDDVFESRTIQKDPDPEVVEWSTKVKKAHPPYQGGSSQFNQHRQYSSVASTQTGTVAGGFNTSTSASKANENYHYRLQDLGLPKDSILIVEVNESANGVLHCPFCENPIPVAAIRDGRCDLCGMLLAGEEDHMSTICEKVEDYLIENRISFSAPIYLLATDTKGERMVMKLNDELNYYIASFTGNSFKPKQNSKADPSAGYHLFDDYEEDYDFYKYSYGEDTHTICCGVKKENIDTDCICEVRMYPSDIITFDAAIQHTSIYQKGSKCYNCNYFYSFACPAYKDIMTAFCKVQKDGGSFEPHVYENSVDGCSNFVDYKNTYDPISAK